MAWAEERINEYRRGSPATWLERRMLEHAHPVHFVVAWVAALGFVYGLWTHDWPWIIGSSALALLGHVYCWLIWKPAHDYRWPRLLRGGIPFARGAEMPERSMTGSGSEKRD